MNFLILINSAPNYKNYYYKLANELTKKGHNIFYAIDSKRSKYLEPIPEIDNNVNSFYFDSFLKKNYKENLKTKIEQSKEYTWGDLFYSDFDRFLTHKFNLKKSKTFWLNVERCLNLFFKEILTNKKIDYILYENISNSFAYTAYLQGQKYNVPYLGLMMSRLPGRFEIQNSIINYELKRLSTLLSKEPSIPEEHWFESYKSSIQDIQPDYMASNNLSNISLLRLIKFEKAVKFFRLLTIRFRYDHRYDYQFGDPAETLAKAIRVNFKRYITTKLSDKYYTSKTLLNSVIGKEEFYVYPIHYHPESSTSVLAPEYTNEYSNIINIANNLPFGAYLYVKDHQSAKGVQSTSFYKKIAALPNVRLINYDVNIKKLILKSKGVITINSTAGYEALLLEKPVYLLGRVFYENFPNVYKIESYHDLKYIPQFKYSECVKNAFIAYKRYTYKGRLFDENDVPIVINHIINHINHM